MAIAVVAHDFADGFNTFTATTVVLTHRGLPHTHIGNQCTGSGQLRAAAD